MPIRLSGMMSGMDTESIISQLVSAKSVKVNSLKKKQISMSWKQDAWKSLNTKLQSFQTKYISNMRFISSYSKKTTKVSNSSAVSVLTGDGAINGSQEMKVSQLAKTGYMTGGAVSTISGDDVTALSSVKDLTTALGADESGVITINNGNKSTDITIGNDTTINDVLTKLKDAGLNANFDAAQKRFYISAKSSGKDNDFSITAKDGNGSAVLNALGLQTDITKDEKLMQSYQNFADKLSSAEGFSNAVKEAKDKDLNVLLDQYKSLVKGNENATKVIQSLKDKYEGENPSFEAADQEQYDSIAAQIEEKKKALEEETDDAKKADIKKELDELTEQKNSLDTRKKDAESYNAEMEKLTSNNEKIDDILEKIEVNSNTDEDGNDTYSAVLIDDFDAELTQKYEEQLNDQLAYTQDVLAGNISAGNAVKINGQDAKITLNDVEYTSSSNVFSINGLTITALQQTAPDEKVTLSTEQDTDGIYDMIKNMLKEYNSLVNEMDKMYNAASAQKYDPLLAEEKEALADSEVEEWEKKIKDSILRRDENLGSINNALQDIMRSSININGKSMSLVDFGIGAGDYFSTADNEKHALHIDGDADDSMTAGNTDKLRAMIASDPDTVISFFSQLSKDIYSKMTDMSKSRDGYRNYGYFYDNTKMKSDYEEYASKISEAEQKLNDYEDKWYKKFSKMETALAKLQSNASAVTGLFGGN